MDMETLLQNPDFRRQMSEAANSREICEILRSYGVDATEEDVEAAAMVENSWGELDEASLDAVTGGASVLPVKTYLRLIFEKLPVRFPIILPVEPVRKVRW